VFADVLVDLSQFAVIRGHWSLQMCCTDAVWCIIETAVLREGKDYEGILHDISQTAKLAIGRKGGTRSASSAPSVPHCGASSSTAVPATHPSRC
jgi:hypothetical protein